MYRFNNCHNRNHPDLYGNGAFFDLETTGRQAEVADRLANELTVGETCIVAAPDITDDITFDWYRFSREAVKRDRERNVDCHAYFGEHFKTETLSRANARRKPIYKEFFNVNGRFKRPSVQRAKIVSFTLQSALSLPGVSRATEHYR